MIMWRSSASHWQQFRHVEDAITPLPIFLQALGLAHELSSDTYNLRSSIVHQYQDSQYVCQQVPTGADEHM